MRTDMRSLRLYGRFDLPRLAARLALLALLFHALLPVTQHLVRQAQAANGIEQVVLCSALGFRTLALLDGAPVDTDPGKTETIAKICPVCLAAAGLQPAILPVAPMLDGPALSVTVLYGAASRSTLAQSPRSPQQARAPPAVSPA